MTLTELFKLYMEKRAELQRLRNPLDGWTVLVSLADVQALDADYAATKGGQFPFGARFFGATWEIDHTLPAGQIAITRDGVTLYRRLSV